MTDTQVKYFNYTMNGAPQINYVPGNGIAILDACLVNGFGSVTLDSLVVASNVATATVSAGHNFPMIVGSNSLTPGVGSVILIAGATPSALNGEWRIASVLSSTQFTFATTGISDQTATGTITAKRAPAGFTKVYSGTNLAAYQANALDATRLFLRADSTAENITTVRMYETMSDINTGTAVSPASGSYDFNTCGSGSDRPWYLFADDRCFYGFIEYNAGQPGSLSGQLFFGDINSFLSTDAYHCGLIGSAYVYQLVQTSSSSIARGYAQTGGRLDMPRTGTYNDQQTMGNTGETYPSRVGNHFFAWPVTVFDGDANNCIMRGLMPGFYAPQHARSSIPSLTLITGIANYPNKQFLTLSHSGYSMAFDLTGPWR